jgi:N-dimethylarginine dimethylaminohydrolase
MINGKVYSGSEIDFNIYNAQDRLEPRKLLMCTPEHYDIVDVKNPYMENNIKTVSRTAAKRQWKALRDVYMKLWENKLLDEVVLINSQEGMEDMIFVANQTFPWLTKSGEKVVVLGKMKHESRQREVPYFAEFFEKNGYRTIELKNTDLFEGTGDTVSHIGKRLLYGGYGYRTDKNAFSELAEVLDIPIVALELVDDRFFMLSMCFLPLDVDTVMIVPDAFSFESYSIIKHMFKNVIRIPDFEAMKYFSLNAHTLHDRKTRNKTVIMQYGSSLSYHALAEQGYNIIEVDTSEFMKSGGSVYNMKLMLY